MILTAFLLAQSQVEVVRVTPVYTPAKRTLAEWMPMQQSFSCWMSHQNGSNGHLRFVLSGGEVYSKSATSNKTVYERWELNSRPTTFELLEDSFGELKRYQIKNGLVFRNEAFQGQIEFEAPNNLTSERWLVVGRSNLSLAPTYEGPRPVRLMSVEKKFEGGEVVERDVKPIASGFCSLKEKAQKVLTSEEIEGLARR